MTRDEADILVEGRVTLYFRVIDGKVWKVAADSHDRKSAVVSQKDFRDARALAIVRINEEREKQKVGQEVPSNRGMSDEEVARFALNQMRSTGRSLETALNVCVDTVAGFDVSRLPNVRTIIGRIGGKASRKRAEARRAKEEKAQEKARQGAFRF